MIVRVLLTGATGFIGIPLMRLLERQGHEAIAVVRSRDVRIDAAATVIWDLSKRVRPDDLPRDIDAVVHAAQSRHHRTFPAETADMLRVNVDGAWSLLDYAAAIGVRRFCLLSSGTVYEPYAGPLIEETPVSPTSFLGATKLAAEILARPYGQLFELCTLRLFFPYGPGQVNRLVPDIINRVRTGRPVQLGSDGAGPWMVPTFVNDIAEVIAAAVTEGWSGLANVASPEIVSLRQLAETIGTLVGRRSIFEQTGREPLRIVPSLDRLASRFDLSRFTSLEQGLRDMMIDAQASCQAH